MSDFPEKAKDEVNTLAVVAIGLSTVAILWASVLALQAFFINSEGEIAAQQAENGRASIVRGLKAEHKADLGRTTYADTQKRTLKRLDIEHAKAVVIRDAQRGAPTLIPTLGELNVPTINLQGDPLKAPAPTGHTAPPTGAPPADTPPTGAPPTGTPPTGTPPAGGTATPPTGTPPAGGTATPPTEGAAPTQAVPAPAAAPVPAPATRPGGQ